MGQSLTTCKGHQGDNKAKGVGVYRLSVIKPFGVRNLFNKI